VPKAEDVQAQRIAVHAGRGSSAPSASAEGKIRT